MSQFAYAVRPNEPCIFVEIFLPRKAELQGILYETLTQGFRRQVVIRHFLNADPGRKQAILEMLGKGWTVFPAEYPTEIEIQSFPHRAGPRPVERWRIAQTGGGCGRLCRN